jgi:hypothetical protein
MLTLFIILYIILLLLGARATWKLILSIFPTAVDGGIFGAVVLFIVLFLVIGAIMGVIAIVKAVIAKIEEQSTTD